LTTKTWEIVTDDGESFDEKAAVWHINDKAM
jgi:hypothetical protein